MRLQIASLNCRGLNKKLKRKLVFEKCKKFDIVTLQETYVTVSSASAWKTEWPGEFFYVGETNHSKGQIILINKRLKDAEIKVLYQSTRILAIHLTIDGVSYYIINVYGPAAHNERANFINELYSLQEKYLDGNTIMCGDFNMVYNNDLDIIAGHPHNERECKNFLTWIESNNLCDVWRQRHPGERDFTWSRPNPFTARRLDYIFCSEELKNCIVKSTHEAIYASDHKAVTVTLETGLFRRGPSYWKFNNALIKDPEFVSTLNQYIEDSLGENLSEDKEIKWELLKVKMKAKIIQYCTHKSKAKQLAEKALVNELNILNKSILEQPDDLELARRYWETKKQLEIQEMARTRGAQTRARIKWIEQGEKNTKFFLGLETQRARNNTISVLRTDDSETFNEHDIIKEIKSHFEGKYKADENITNIEENLEEFLENGDHPILKEEEREYCETPISIEELDAALGKINTESAPGVDGLTALFYKCFWDKLREPYYDSVNESIRRGELSISQRRGVITLIPKGDNLGRDNINNWRPITLTNIDYKIISKTLASRLQGVVDSIVHHNQSGFLKGRTIAQHIRLLDDIINHTSKVKGHGLLVSLDFQKAFDTVEKDTILAALRRFNFGPYFTGLIKTIISNTECCVQNGGWISEFFKTERGIKQGCCVSPILFVLVVELLAIKLRANKEVQGIISHQLNDSISELKVLQYADDTTLLLRNKRSLMIALQDIDQFYKISGLRLNRKKSYGLWLGADAGSNNKPGDITWVEKGQYVKVLGIYFSADREASEIDLNWKDRIEKIEVLIRRWQRRNLSLYGKIIVAKTFLLSQLTYVIQALSLPETVLNTIDSLLFRFIWKKKFSNKKAYEKVKRVVLCKDISEGGLRMIRVKDQQRVFLLRWLQKVASEKAERTFYGIPGIIFSNMGGPRYFIESSACDRGYRGDNIPSRFWASVAIVWRDLKRRELASPVDVFDILSQPLFNNDCVRYKGNTICFKAWIQSGIKYVANIVDRGNLKSINTLRETIGNRPQLQFEYNALINALPRSWINTIKEESSDDDISLVLNSSHNNWENALKVLVVPNRIIRDALNHQTVTICGRNFWMNKFNVDINYKYNLAHECCLESRLRLLHFKILHNCFPTNILLNRMKISNSELCEHCKVPDYIEHFFVNCKRLTGYWEHVFNIINAYSKYQFPQKQDLILLGICKEDALGASNKDLQLANHLLLLGKVCVSKMRYGEFKNIFIIFDLEWSLRKNSLMRDQHP